MAIAFLLEFPGVTQEQYDQATDAIERSGIKGEGRIFHVAGPMEGGWRIVDVWESQEAFDTFFQKTAPISQESGMATPQLKVEVWSVHNSISGA